jgi:hypothetical protein
MANRSRIVVTGEPGLAGRQFALADPDFLLDRDGAGALYIGADPLCDVVLADPAAEAWHARLVGQGDHGPRGEIDGSSTRSPTCRTILVKSCSPQACTVLAPRTRLPEPLAAVVRRLRVRVTDPRGESEMLGLGDADRLRDGVVFGSHLSCDVLVCSPGVYPRHLRLVERQHLLAEVLAGEVQLPDSGSPTPELRGPGSFTAAAEPCQRWRRFRLGRCEFQLCRWPARDEPPRRRTTPTAPIVEPPPPPSAPPPPLRSGPPRSLPPGLDPARCLAALIAGVRARPRRSWLLRSAAEATAIDRDVAELLRAWSEHQVGLLRIGALQLTDTLRAPRPSTRATCMARSRSNTTPRASTS